MKRYVENPSIAVLPLTLVIGTFAGCTNSGGGSSNSGFTSDRTVEFVSPGQSLAENGGIAVARVEISSPAAVPISVPFTVTGSAAVGVDFLVDASPLEIPSGSTGADITITVLDDELDELDEAIVIELGAPADVDLGTITVHTADVLDDDLPPVVEFTTPDLDVSEPDATAAVTIALSGESGLDVSVPLLVGGTAVEGVDFSLSMNPAVIPAGATSVALEITLTDDLFDEDDETIALSIDDPTNASVGAAAAHETTVVDDDPEPVVDFLVPTQGVGEIEPAALVDVVLSTPSGKEIVVPFTTSGTAVFGDDFTFEPADGQLVIPAGESGAQIAIVPADDSLDEEVETVTLDLGVPVNAGLGTLVSNTTSIVDDDVPPTVGFEVGSQDVSESAGTATVAVALSALSGLDVTVPFTVSGTATAADFSIGVSSVVVPAGELTAEIVIDLADDGVQEPSETVVLDLGAPTNATLDGIATHTATILDNDDAPTVQFAAAVSSVGEGGGQHNIALRLSQLSGIDVSVPFTLSGSAIVPEDYTISASPAVIPAGSIGVNLVADIADDGLHELAEDVVVTLGAPTNANLGGATVHTLTITDDDPQPTVGFAAAAQTGGEDDALLVAVELSAVAPLDVTVPFTVTGSATRDDYTLSGNPLVIPAGDVAAFLTVTLVDDPLHEAEETVELTITGPTNATLGANDLHTVTITNDDAPPSVAFVLDSQTVSEDDGAVTATVALSAVSGLDVTVPVSVRGTATAVDDYDFAPDQLVIPAGESSVDLGLALVDDDVAEPDETIDLTLGQPTNATLSQPAQHVVTVTDDEGPPTVQFASASQTVLEADGQVAVTVELSGQTADDVAVSYATTGTALPAVDFDVPAGPVIVPAGSTSADIVVTLVDDDLFETDETIQLTIFSATNAGVGTQAVHVITITNDDAQPSVGFNSPGQSVPEGAGPAFATVELSAVSGLDVFVPFTVGGSALDPDDYTLSPSSIVVLAGDTSATVTMTFVDDVLDELDETIELTLGSPTNATAGAILVHTATILDDDAQPAVDLTAAQIVAAESDASATFTVQLTGPSGLDVEVPFTLSGTASDPDDYTTTATSPLVFPAGDVSMDVVLTLSDDSLHEGDETVVLALGAPTNASLGSVVQSELTLTDDDVLPVVEFVASAQSTAESTAQAVAFLSLSAPSGVDVEVPFTVTGLAKEPDDYTIDASPIVIPAGESDRMLVLSLVNDTIDELDETVTITLGTPTDATLGASTVHTVTILDDDAPPVVNFALASQSVGEEAGLVPVTVELSNASGHDVTVDFTLGGNALVPNDVSVTASPLTIPAGDLSADIGVAISNDELDEDDEILTLTLGPATNAILGAPSVHSLTIVDNDGLPLTGGDLSITPSAWTMYVGQTVELAAHGLPDGAVEWTLFDAAGGAFLEAAGARSLKNPTRFVGGTTPGAFAIRARDLTTDREAVATVTLVPLALDVALVETPGLVPPGERAGDAPRVRVAATGRGAVVSSATGSSTRLVSATPPASAVLRANLVDLAGDPLGRLFGVVDDGARRSLVTFGADLELAEWSAPELAYRPLLAATGTVVIAAVDDAGGSLVVVDPSGVVLDLVPIGHLVDVRDVRAMTVDARGAVTLGLASELVSIEPDGSVVRVPLAPSTRGYIDLAAGWDGLFAAPIDAAEIGAVALIDALGNEVERLDRFSLGGTVDDLTGPQAAAFRVDGRLYVVDRTDGSRTMQLLSIGLAPLAQPAIAGSR